MVDAVREALTKGGVIDITTTGRRTGQARRKEIVFHSIDGHLYISGTPRPRKRDWLRNLEAQPRFMFHLKGDVSVDLPATARVITNEAERRDVLTSITRNWNREGELDEFVRNSPLIEVTIPAW